MLKILFQPVINIIITLEKSIKEHININIYNYNFNLLFPTSYNKHFQHRAKLKKFVSKQLYFYCLDYSNNILLYVFYHISIHLSIPLAIHYSLLLFMYFKMNVSVCILLTRFQYYL